LVDVDKCCIYPNNLFGDNFKMVHDDSHMFVLNVKNKSQERVTIEEDIKQKIKELSKLRKSISLDLKKIADQTKISTNQLKNIEAFKFDKLPPNPMRKSFINQYCLEIERAKK
tara:strand:+ start:968 stop:1306 length:339 start_codon:yes stop_codon:yes gene_type:complete